MATGEAIVRIGRTPSEVFAVLSDVEQNPRWSTSAIESHLTSAGPVGVGSTAHEMSRFLGRRVEVDAEIVAFEPDHLVGVLVTGGPVPLRAWFHVDPVDGGAQVRVTFEARPSGPLRHRSPVRGHRTAEIRGGPHQPEAPTRSRRSGRLTLYVGTESGYSLKRSSFQGSASLL